MKYIREIIIAILIVYAGVATYSWFQKPAPVPPKATYVAPQVSPAVEKAPQVMVPVKALKVYKKEKIVDNLRLSGPVKKELKENPAEQIEDTGKIDFNPKKESGADVVAVVNTETGETKMLVTPRPLPFMQFLNDKELGMRVGISTYKGLSVDVYGRWTFARVGPLYAALYLEGSSSIQGKGTPEAKAMAEISYRW